MARPTVSDVHVNRPLSNISVAYSNAEFIADQVFPLVSVEKKSDSYFTFGKSAWFRDEAAQRAPGTRAARGEYDISTASYVCVPYALATPLPDEVRANADDPLRPGVTAVEYVTNSLLLAREIRVANIVTGSANWAYSSSPSTQWSSDTSEPETDIDNAINGVVSEVGRFPNVAAMSWDVWRRLKNHPNMLERLKYTRPGGVLTTADLREWFGFDKVLIGMGLRDTSKDGQSASMGFIWGDDFWCGYVPGNAALMTPAAGYILEWGSRTVSEYREDQEHQDVYEVQEFTDEVITASDAGAIVYSAV